MQRSNEYTHKQAQSINTISRFLALRDLPDLTVEDVKSHIGSCPADLLIILGNSVLTVTEQAAKAYQAGIAKAFMIVGGIGHATSFLIEAILNSSTYSDIHISANTSEAEILLEVAAIHAGLDANQVIIEMESTNCGNNAAFAWQVLQKRGMTPQKIILMQDPTLQLRTYASFQRAWKLENSEACFYNYAAMVPQIAVIDKQFYFVQENEMKVPLGSKPPWSIPRFISLIMGEIPRLYDDEHGYGPNGKGYIDHVQIPKAVMSAYRELLPAFESYTRPAKGS